jgi:hypothetical protein
MLVWTCTENGRKLNSQKSIVYEFVNKTKSQGEVREDGRIVGGEE